MTISSADLSLMELLLSRATQAGADEADVVFMRSTSLSVQVRLNKVEMVERSESGDIGLRVIKNKRQAVVSTSDLRPDALAALPDKALGMAAANPENIYLGLATPLQLTSVRSGAGLDLADAEEPSAALLTQAALRAEAAALAVDGVTNSDGGQASWGLTEGHIMASNGFSAGTARTSSGIAASVVAGSGADMQTDYDYDSAVHWSDLRTAEEIGQRAGEQAVRSLSPRQLDSKPMPVVYDHRQARDLLGTFLSAINGNHITRKSSFLMDKMGQGVFKKGVFVEENPFVKRGMRSRAYDSEGLAPRPFNLVEDGTLMSWVLDLRTARQLDLAPTGHGARGVSSAPAPSVSNVILRGEGAPTRDELLADIKEGFYVTQILGHDFDMVTGNYSRGARGFFIENGKLTYPVSGVTIAGNMRDMLLNLTPASDLERRFGIDTPTVRIDGMVVAGR